MSKLYTIPVKIYAAIAQSFQLPYLVKVLYLFARSLDKRKGRGYVTIDLGCLAKTLNRSELTLKVALREGKKLGVFYACRFTGRVVTVSYQSLPKLCASIGISDLGAIFELDCIDLNELRSQCVRHTVARKQNQSRHLANLQGKREWNRKSMTPASIFKSASSIKSSGVKSILDISGHVLFVSETFINYGVSQAKVASILERTPQTIRKHLGKTKQLEAVASLQICQEAHSNHREYSIESRLFKEQQIDKVNYFWYKKKLFSRTTNIYDFGTVRLFCSHNLRKRVSKFFEDNSDLYTDQFNKKKRRSRMLPCYA